MVQWITKAQIIARLDESRIPYRTLTLQDGVDLLLCQRGARIFGPFLDGEGVSLYWVNPAFADAQRFAAFLSAGDWNLGGERLWIAPEVQYLVRDRADFWNSIHFPTSMDPGEWRFESSAVGMARLAQELDLVAYNLGAGVKQLQIETLIRPIPNPLRAVRAASDLMEGVRYAGYEQEITLRERVHNELVAEVWNLIQLNPGGILLLPASPRVEHTDYFEPIDDAHQTHHPGHIRLRITGTRRYKVGYKAAHLYGRVGYLNRHVDGNSYLLVRNFFNNPSAAYAEEPAGLPGQSGHSFHVYNDGGGFGGFGELECNGQTIGGATGRTSSTDQMALWLFVGEEHKLREICIHLLGVDPTSE